jgi:CDGSH iron-sulfur domain-containing protein 3
MTNKPTTAFLSPVQVDLEEGQSYRWCRCGHSKKLPFCDNSHDGTGREPVTFVAKKTETVILCGCQETDDPPFCDGTHNIL